MTSQLNLKGTAVQELRKIENIENSNCEYIEIEITKEEMESNPKTDIDISKKFINEVYKRLWLDSQLKLTTHFMKMNLPVSPIKFTTGSELYKIMESREEYKDLHILRNELEEAEYFLYDESSVKITLEYGQIRETEKEDNTVYRIPYKVSIQNTLEPNIIKVQQTLSTQ